MIKVMQVNLGRARNAHDVALATARKEEIDLLIISEPNKKIAENRKFLCDTEKDISVQILNQDVGIRRHISGTGFIVLTFNDWALAVGYISPNVRTEIFQDIFDNMMEVLRGEERHLLIAGDFNAKSPLWGANIEDERGSIIVEWMAQVDLIILNDGEHTFERAASKTHIDITATSTNFANRVTNWHMTDEHLYTLHRYIFFQIGDKSVRPQNIGQKKILNLHLLEQHVEQNVGDQYDTNSEFLEDVKRAVEESMETLPKAGHLPYWWTENIGLIRRGTINKRRIATRAASRFGHDDERTIIAKEQFKEQKTQLSRAIQKEKRSLWKKLCEELEDDIWGEGYKIANRHLGRIKPPYNPTKGQKIEWCRELFPSINDRRILRWSFYEEDLIPNITIDELETSIGGMKTKRAAGPDSIPPEVWHILSRLRPQLLLNVLNSQLKKQEMPYTWKEANVVLAWKGKTTNEAKSYRPICLINTIAKLFESIVRNRLIGEIEAAGDFSPQQHGFRKGHSAVDAINQVLRTITGSRYKWVALIAVDVRNAFNSAPWNQIVKRLINIGISQYLINIIDDYLYQRSIQISGKKMKINTGVPQGSVLGPALWNVLYDEVLNLNYTGEVTTVAFADDLMLIVGAKTIEDLNHTATEALAKITHWMRKNNLRIAPEKTECVIVKGSRNRAEVNIKIQNVEISIKRKIKYLGVIIDDKLSFTEHAKYAINKTKNRIKSLQAIMPNIGGPSSKKRQALYGVAQSILLYAAPTWKSVIDMTKYQNLLNGMQRIVLLRVASAYRTVSGPAIQVVTGIPPLDLLVKERCRIHAREDSNTKAAKQQEREVTLNLWEERWMDAEDSRGGWTKRVISNLRSWVNCPFRRTDYYLTQVLSGHGSFGSFTCKIQKTDTADCLYCGQFDTPEHTLFECIRWDQERQAILNTYPGLNIDTLMQTMIDNKQNFMYIHRWIKELMDTKEKEDYVLKSMAQNW